MHGALFRANEFRRLGASLNYGNLMLIVTVHFKEIAWILFVVFSIHIFA